MSVHDRANDEEFRQYVEQSEKEITELQEKVLRQIRDLTELLIRFFAALG